MLPTRLRFMMLVVLSVAVGCASDHVRPDDAGPLGDVGPDIVDAPPPRCGLEPPAFACVIVGAAHVCDDVAWSAECVGNTWQCPRGTSSSAECWCSAVPLHDPRCVCTPSGWQCPDPGVPDGSVGPDGGVDAGAICPADPRSVEGMRCNVEGQTCGSCPNACSGLCDLVTCVGHTWRGIDTGCAQVMFPCGPTRFCEQATQYCQHVLSDVAGIPDDWTCLPMPSGCASASCACFDTSSWGGRCTIDSAGDVTLTLGGG